MSLGRQSKLFHLAERVCAVLLTKRFDVMIMGDEIDQVRSHVRMAVECTPTVASAMSNASSQHAADTQKWHLAAAKLLEAAQDSDQSAAGQRMEGTGQPGMSGGTLS